MEVEARGGGGGAAGVGGGGREGRGGTPAAAVSDGWGQDPATAGSERTPRYPGLPQCGPPGPDGELWWRARWTAEGPRGRARVFRESRRIQVPVVLVP